MSSCCKSLMPRFSKLNGKQSRTSHSIKLCNLGNRGINITMIAINNSRLITLWYFLLITCVLFERKTVILMIVTSGIWLTQWGLGGRQLFALILHSAGPEIYAYTTLIPYLYSKQNCFCFFLPTTNRNIWEMLCCYSTF